MGQKQKRPSLRHFFTNFDENAHEGSASDGESESLLILKNLFGTVGQKQKHPSLHHFFTNFDENAHEG